MSKWFSDNKLDIVKRFVNVLRASLCSMSFICLFAYLLLTFIEHVYKDDTPQDETVKDSKNYLMLNIQTILKHKILLPNCVCSQIIMVIKIIVVVQSFSHVQLFVTPWTATRQTSLSFTSPKACSNSCPWSQWCHPTISSSVVPFSSCLQPFPALGSFPMSQLFASVGQSIGASTSVLPMNIQGRFPLGWADLISLQSKGLSRVFSNTTVWKHQFFGSQPSLWSTFHIHTWPLEKNHSFEYLDLCQQKKSLLFNILSRFVIAFLPRGKCILISWLQSPSLAMLEPKKLKSVTVSIVFIITNLLHEKRS